MTYVPVLVGRRVWGLPLVGVRSLLLRGWLDAEAEVYVLLVAGVGVEVVGGAAVELVALADLATDEEADGYGSEAGRDPADGLDEGGLFVLFLSLARGRGRAEGRWRGGPRCWCRGRFGAELHAMDDSAGWREFGS